MNYTQLEYLKRSPNATIQKRSKLFEFKNLHETYKVIDCIGYGGFGHVLSAKYLNDKSLLYDKNTKYVRTLLEPLEETKKNKSSVVAIKVLYQVEKNPSLYYHYKEIRFALTVPSHPCLIQVHDMFIDSSTSKLHIVMESLNQNLSQLINGRGNIKFTTRTLKSILSQLINGLKHIHKHNFIHRDVKPENVLVIPTAQYYGDKTQIPPFRKNDSYIVKLADYGLSRRVDSTAPYTSYVGTRWYRSPEIILERVFHSTPLDIWAFGVMAVELMNFKILFPGESNLDQIFRIFEVLGCPNVNRFEPKSSYKQAPLGGYWKEAQYLGSALGIYFPSHKGSLLYDIIQNKDYLSDGLRQVIGACLLWNPSNRADVSTLCSMDYFRDSCAYERPNPSVRYKSNVPLTTTSAATALRNVSSNCGRVLNLKENCNYLYTDFNDGYEGEFMNPNFRDHGKSTKYNTLAFTSSDGNEEVVPRIDVDLDSEVNEDVDTASFDSDNIYRLVDCELQLNETEFSFTNPRTFVDQRLKQITSYTNCGISVLDNV